MTPPALAAWQMLSSPQVTVAFGRLGFSWVIVDLEHASLSVQETEHIFIAARSVGLAPYARLPSADPYMARRLLDAGAVGLLVPVVEDRKAFDDFARHCFYPPRGCRGLGLVAANHWGEDLETSFHKFQPRLIAQIETKQGALNAETIMDSPFLWGVMIGPYDLSASLHKPGQFNDPDFLQYKDRVFKAATQCQKKRGFHQVIPDNQALEKVIQEGYDFIAYGTDIVAMRHALKI